MGLCLVCTTFAQYPLHSYGTTASVQYALPSHGIHHSHTVSTAFLFPQCTSPQTEPPSSGPSWPPRNPRRSSFCLWGTSPSCAKFGTNLARTPRWWLARFRCIKKWGFYLRCLRSYSWIFRFVVSDCWHVGREKSKNWFWYRTKSTFSAVVFS